MDLILKVLEGAKEGTKIAIKKEKFLIGRSPKCHLCVGSTAVSRKHCAIRRNDAKATIEDLGSRNGTLINGNKIAAEEELKSGDEVTIGPLKFLVTISLGINNSKKPHVTSVADAVQRTEDKESHVVEETDISDWLLEPTDPPSSQAFAETQTIEMDDTNALQLQMQETQEMAEVESNSTEEDQDQEQEEDESKDDKKKEPGKLPPIPTSPATKDSREAAAEALRNWNRRR